MKKTSVLDTASMVGKNIELFGTIHTIRNHKKIVFIDLRDRTGVVQVVGNETHAHLNSEDIVKVTGTVKERPPHMVNDKIKTGNIEIVAEKIDVIGKAELPPFDMSKDTLQLTLPTLLDYRSLSLRHPQIRAIFKVQAAIAEGFRKISTDIGCIEIFVPQIAGSSTEGGSEVFKFAYYDREATLTQSPQLYKQMLVPVFERVYTIAHAYRAEPSVTTRHLAETIQLDCEMGHVTFEELLDDLEKVGVEMIRYAEETCEHEMKLFQEKKVLYGKIPRLKLTEAQEIIFKETKRDVRGEKDLSPRDEIDICAWAAKEHGTDFVTITHFPTGKRAFYTMPDPENPEVSLSYDLLFRGLEIASGSQRIHNYKDLTETIKKRGMNPKDFEMYLMAFKYGMPPEGGFSFGLERVTKNLLGLINIREAALYPRDMDRIV
ncbi:MAG: aspartate--tRNA(Asn) ligase [Patescibacteria group bacterium]